MLKNKKNKAEDKDSNGKNKKRINATLKPFLLLWLTTAIMGGVIAFSIHRIAELQIVQQASNEHLDILANSIADQLDNRFNSITAELAALAEDPYIQKVIKVHDPEAFSELATTLQNSFRHSQSVRIIPWDFTATVGLKERGIEMNNSIETLMVTRAGGGRVPEPEAYQLGNEWLFSFAQPIKLGDDIHAVIFVSFDRNLVNSVINNAFNRENAAISVTQKGQKKQIVGNGQKPAGATRTMDLPFTDGQVVIASIKQLSSVFQPAFLTLYILVGVCGIVLLIMTFVGLLMLTRSLKTDRLLLVQYAESLSGLHRTQPPILLHKELGPVTDMLNHVGATMRKNAVIPDDGREKIDHGKTPPPKHLATAEVTEEPTEEPADKETPPFNVPHIFRDYDIRGIADSELTDDNVRLIGRAIGSEASLLKSKSLVVGRDGRLSSQRIFDALSQGIRSTGCEVIDIGVVPTPVLYYAAQKSEHGSGIMITGSHNPAEYNGLKIVLQGKTLQGPLIQRLLKRIQSDNLVEPQEPGLASQQDYTAAYMDEIAGDILIARPLKVVIDAANGTGGEIAQQLFSRLNCDVTVLNGEIDGNFPNHSPDPTKAENLASLIDTVKQNQAELGIAFDGDADRLVAVTGSGRIVMGDQLLMFFAQDIVSRNPAASVVYDVKCSSRLKGIIQQLGGRPVLWKTGHANIKDKVQEINALLGGEFSGHYCFKERWYGFDDGIYAALRLLELLTNDETSLDQRLDELPQTVNTPELYIPTQNDEQKFAIVEKLKKTLAGESGDINTLDGIRIDYPAAWGLVRASNTTAALTARFEADNQETLEQVQSSFREALKSIDGDLNIPF